MTKSQSDQIFANRLLKWCAIEDQEQAHVHADAILVDALRDAGYTKTAEQFQLLKKAFYYA